MTSTARTVLSALAFGHVALLCAHAAHACPPGAVMRYGGPPNITGQGSIGYCDYGGGMPLHSADEPEAAGAPAPEVPRDPLAARVDFAMNLLRLQQSHIDQFNHRMKNDPAFAKGYREVQRGEWQQFRTQGKAKPGEFCGAIFLSRTGTVALTGPGGGYSGAMLIFTGTKVPAPARIRQIPVTLTQTGEAPQTVKAFNYVMGGTRHAAIALAVPTIDAALAGMLDKQRFQLAIEGQPVVDVEWHSGAAARDGLRRCLGGGGTK